MGFRSDSILQIDGFLDVLPYRTLAQHPVKGYGTLAEGGMEKGELIKVCNYILSPAAFRGAPGRRRCGERRVLPFEIQHSTPAKHPNGAEIVHICVRTYVFCMPIDLQIYV